MPTECRVTRGAGGLLRRRTLAKAGGGSGLSRKGAERRAVVTLLFIDVVL